MKRTLDHQKVRDGLAKAFSEIAKASGEPGSHRATQEVLRRPRPAHNAESRLLHFVQIARGRRA